MEKQPFDETGLQQLLTELYALPDFELSEQAFAFRNHTKLWINGKFDLDPQQLAFLQEMSPAAINFLAQQGGFAIENRLPVTLVKTHQSAEPSQDPPKQDKWFTTSSSLNTAIDGNGHTVPGGTLQLEVVYYDEPSENS